MIFKDYYKILGLETTRVSIDEIKNAYRSSAKKYHPDLNMGNTFAEERIKDINEAYRVLSSPATKRKYDRKWNTYVGGKSSLFNKKLNSKEILKEMLFVSNNKKETNNIQPNKGKPQKGEDVETQIKANLFEAYYGSEKKISFKSIDGYLKTITVTIPEGIRDGEKIRLIGQGKPGKNGGKPGDLFIQIKISNDKRFKLKGYDIYTQIYLTPWEAALGTRVNIKSVDEDVAVYIPQGTSSGEQIRIPGKGYKKEQGKRGELIAEIKIMVPKALTKQEEQIYIRLKEISEFNPRTKQSFT